MGRILRTLSLPGQGGRIDWGPEIGGGLPKATHKPVTLLGLTPGASKAWLGVPSDFLLLPPPRAKLSFLADESPASLG